MILRRSVGLRLALLFVRRIHVGGRGGELRGAGVDALVDRDARRARGGACAHAPSRTCRCRRREAAVGEALALERAQALGGRARSRPPLAHLRAPRSTRSSICARNHGSMCVSSCDRARSDQPARNASATYSRRFGARRRAARRRACCAVSSVSGSVDLLVEAVEPVSRPRSAFCSDSWNVRPIAIDLAHRLHLRGEAVVRGRGISRT